MFSGSTQAVRRFSLLLLEEGELYVEDFVASVRWPSDVSGNWQRLPCMAGQLRLCTKSLFFEPDDVRVPIVRLPFQNVEGMEGAGEQRLLVTITRVVKMRANAVDAPYVVEKAGVGEQARPHPLHWEFELSYARLEEVMPLAQQMMVASRLPAAEQEEFLQATMTAAKAGARFDLGGLRSPAERILSELAATLLSQGALVREPGRLLITDQRLYFQPLHNISGDAAVSSHPLTAVAAVVRRRSSLRDVALEVFFAEPPDQQQHLASPPFWAGASALFAFSSRDEREQAVAVLAAQPALGTALPGGREAASACSAILEADPSWLSRVTAAWQRGLLSNLDYLLFLNLASGRSFNDLSQYPVMPWVLADYASPSLDLSCPAAFRDLSLPVGALNPRRLAMLRERYADMAGFSPEPPFLYGSHYSTPGFTMFWLVRAAPAHMLRLQAGRFDAPDRLFCSVREAWEGVTSTNPADVKELIPEFFLKHDFLLNLRSLGLGTRQSGRPVGDVELPPWAPSAAHFQAMHRAALEAPFVSANLHHWVDLIFGYKQRGEAAEEADNVFRHTAYEGVVDIEAVADRTERVALETQIAEFGQCARQLFRQKHPQRLVCPPAELPQPGAAAAAQAGVGGMAEGSSQALPLALVSTILAVAGQGAGDSPRVEVPPQLAELDVLAARRRQQMAEVGPQAAVAPPAAAAVATAAEGQLAAAGSSGDPPEWTCGKSPGKQPAASPAGGRLRSLGAWAAERKQAVGERLAGSVGTVRDVLAGPADGSSADAASASGGSASRLQSLFSRKGPSASASSSSTDVTAAGGAGAGAGVGGSQQQVVTRSSPQFPAGRSAAGLVSSIGGRISSFTLARGKGLCSPLLAPVEAGAPPASLQQAAGAAAAPDAAAGAALGSPLWKYSHRGAERAAASTGPTGQQGATADGSSSEDEGSSPGQQRRRRQGVPATGSTTAQRTGSGRAAADLLEAQRQRMLRHGRGDCIAAGAGVGAVSAGGRAAAAAAAGGAPDRPSGWYGAGLRDRLMPIRVLSAGSESINGCALAAVGGMQHAYSASHSGSLRVHRLPSGEQVRASSISEQPLTSVALLHTPSSSGDGGSGGGGQRHPLALCGSFDAFVHVYSPEYGRRLGSFRAATDAVACLQVVGGGSRGSSSSGNGSSAPPCIITTSWDGSVRSWELAEGRQPWDSTLPDPTWAVQAPSGVWALAVAPAGGLVLAGTEDGLVVAWDPRQPPGAPMWRHQLLTDNYIGGLDLCPGGAAAVVAAADGSLSLLDLRRTGAVVAMVTPSRAPLRCCATDGVLALAGDEGGGLHMWHVAQQLGAQAPLPVGVWTPPQPDGLFPPLAPNPVSAINALAAAPSGCGGVDVVTGHESGQVRWLSTVPIA